VIKHQLIVEIDGTLDPDPILDQLLGTHPQVESWARVSHKWIPIKDHPVGFQQFVFVPLRYRKGCAPSSFGGEEKIVLDVRPAAQPYWIDSYDQSQGLN
jgi:hypothetical protein